MTTSIQSLVTTVRALAEAEATESSALATLDGARDVIARSIVALGFGLSLPDAPSQRALATAVKAAGITGWSQPTISRVVNVYAAAQRVRVNVDGQRVTAVALDEESGAAVLHSAEAVLTLRTLSVQSFDDGSKRGKAGSALLSSLLRTADGEGDDAATARQSLSSLSGVQRAMTALATSGTLPTRSDKGQARPGQSVADGKDNGASAPGTATVDAAPAPVKVTSLAEDSITAMGGWVRHLEAVAATTVPGSIDNSEAVAWCAMAHKVIAAATAAIAVVESAVTEEQAEQVSA